MSLKVWRTAEYFNSSLFKSKPKYILLIFATKAFDLFKDLEFTLRIRNKNPVWFSERFRQIKAHVMYLTPFTNEEKKNLGPIATDLSEGIYKQFFENNYKDEDSIYFVCPAYIQKKLPNHLKFVTTENFVDSILLN